MTCQSIISVNALTGPGIYTREAAHFVLKAAAVYPCDQVELDFSGIDFIGRSFADEFHFQKLRMITEWHKDIIVTNAAPLVLQILNSVARTQHATVARQPSPIPVLKFATQRDLNSYLVSI